MLSVDKNEFVWSEKYRPQTVEECVLPTALKARFQAFVDDGNVPNLILAGPPGVGKTTVAKAMLTQLGCDVMVINASLKGNIDTLRNEIQQFASSVSFLGGRKYVILDEADYLNAQSTQPALRGFIQDFSANCGFILTCNYLQRIIEPLHSRLAVIDFGFGSDKNLAAKFFGRVMEILEAEGVKYDRSVLAQLIMNHFPDMRRVLSQLQEYAKSGTIDTGILAKVDEQLIRELFEHLKAKRWTEMRQWVGQNTDTEARVILRKMYEMGHNYVAGSSLPELVLFIRDGLHKEASCNDSEINLVGTLTEIMASVEFR